MTLWVLLEPCTSLCNPSPHPTQTHTQLEPVTLCGLWECFPVLWHIHNDYLFLGSSLSARTSTKNDRSLLSPVSATQPTYTCMHEGINSIQICDIPFDLGQGCQSLSVHTFVSTQRFNYGYLLICRYKHKTVTDLTIVVSLHHTWDQPRPATSAVQSID